MSDQLVGEALRGIEHWDTADLRRLQTRITLILHMRKEALADQSADLDPRAQTILFRSGILELPKVVARREAATTRFGPRLTFARRLRRGLGGCGRAVARRGQASGGCGPYMLRVIEGPLLVRGLEMQP